VGEGNNPQACVPTAPAPLVARAQGIVGKHAGCTVEEALTLLQEVALATDETLDIVAELVVRGEVGSVTTLSR
jgi:AmiR/NasT family two-component response regulator